MSLFWLYTSCFRSKQSTAANQLDTSTLRKQQVDTINGFEMKSFIDECFGFSSPDHKLLPGYRRVTDRLYHSIADCADNVAELTLQRLVSM